MAEENAVIGKETALEKEIVVLRVRGLEIYINTNMEVKAKISK